MTEGGRSEGCDQGSEPSPSLLPGSPPRAGSNRKRGLEPQAMQDPGFSFPGCGAGWVLSLQDRGATRGWRGFLEKPERVPRPRTDPREEPSQFSPGTWCPGAHRKGGRQGLQNFLLTPSPLPDASRHGTKVCRV